MLHFDSLNIIINNTITAHDKHNETRTKQNKQPETEQHTTIPRPNVMRFSFVMNDKYLIHASVCQCDKSQQCDRCMCLSSMSETGEQKKKTKNAYEYENEKYTKRAKNEKRMKKNMCLTASVCMTQTQTIMRFIYALCAQHMEVFLSFWASQIWIVHTDNGRVHMQLYK